LNEEVMLRIKLRSTLRTFEIKGKPFLDAVHFSPLGQIEEEHQVEAEWCRKDTVTAEKIDFDLHWITQPSEHIDIVTTLFVLSPLEGSN
jgi:hypothetical protein